MKKLVLSVVIVFGITQSSFAQDQNVILGLDGPAYGALIKINLSGNGGWARGFSIANQDNTKRLFSLGAYGTHVNGSSDIEYGYIGKDYDQTYMTFLPNGNIGVGTNTPENSEGWEKAFEVRGQSHSKVLVSNSLVTAGVWSHSLGYYGAPAGGITGTFTNHPFSIMTNKSTKMTIATNGNVGIGTTSPADKLSVNGNIRAKEIKVEAGNWPDYVFKKEYQLTSLEETEKHIKEYGYLPGMPSAKEVETNGIELGEMNKKLLLKLEELTLHTIALQKQVNKLQTQNDLINKNKRSNSQKKGR